jgi:iron-sulfur cluster repair protein YtfE (RIC family)
MRDYEECRPYIDHLRAEHRRLHAMLIRARSAVQQMNGPDRDAKLSDVAKILEQVRVELAQHFAEEEEGGCLEEAVSRCPRLSHDANRIESEHVEILAELDRLIAEAKDGPENVATRIAVGRDFDELCTQLHAHEAAENALLRDAFGAGVNGDESEPLRILDY